MLIPVRYTLKQKELLNICKLFMGIMFFGSRVGIVFETVECVLWGEESELMM